MTTRSSNPRGWWIVTIVLLIAVAAATVTVVVVTGSNNAADAVTLEPAGVPGVDPFTASVQIGPVVEFPGNVQAIVTATRSSLPVDPKAHVHVATGTAPGLYGGSGDAHVCDPAHLVSFLQQHPDKAAAWAGVLGIGVSSIADYVGSLTPVVLTSDTLVTNHGFRDGHATTLQSVLQAGTAVMVDRTGTPRVKCNCGNPLTEPQLIAPQRTVGTAWPGYSASQVTVVRSGAPVDSITVRNVNTGETYVQPVGPSAAGVFVTASGAQVGVNVLATSRDGSSWSIVHSMPTGAGAIAYGNNQWLLLQPFSRGEVQTNVLASTDLEHWQTVATVAATLNDVAYGDGRWVAVGRAAPSAPSEDEFAGPVVYSSIDAHAWKLVAMPKNSPQLTSVAFGNGSWLAVGNGIHQGGEPSITVSSTDGVHWIRQNDVGLDTVETQALLAYGAGKWALGGASLAAQMTGSPDRGIITTSTNGIDWTAGSTARVPNEITGIAFGAGLWLAITSDGLVYSSTDAVSWSRRGHATPGADLAFGVVAANDFTPSRPTTPSTPSTESVPTTIPARTASLTRFDWKNFTYRDISCASQPSVKLTNGEWRDPIGCHESLTSVDYADVTGDGVVDAIVNLEGDGGGNAFTLYTAVFTAGPNGPVNRGYFEGDSFPPYAGNVVTWLPDPGPNDPRCCPTNYAKATYVFSKTGGSFVKARTDVVPASEYPKR